MAAETTRKKNLGRNVTGTNGLRIVLNMGYKKISPVEKFCAECSKSFLPKQNHPKYKFCSYLCKSRNRYKEDSAKGKIQEWTAKKDKDKVRKQQKEYYHNNSTGRKDYGMNKTAERRFLEKKSKILFNSELTSFVFQEAKKLQRLRKVYTNIDWHIDHIIPLKGQLVCGLHVWNNLQVITSLNNLRKGNRYAIYD